MALAFPEPIYTDGNLSIAAAVGLPIYSCPIRAVNTAYVVSQDFVQNISSFSTLPLGTGFDRDSSFKLVSEGPRQDIGGGLVKWTRTYARLPASHDEFESYSYSFIGFQGVWTVGNLTGTSIQATGRPRQSHVVTSRVRHDYFYSTEPGTIPVIKSQRYLNGAGPGPTEPLDTDYLYDAVLVPSTPASSPSRTEYVGMINAGDEIVAEDSRLSRWLGNFYLRQTRYVVAK